MSVLSATLVSPARAMQTQTGTLRDEFPYVRVGDGPRTLVVLPGLSDAMFSGRFPSAAGPALATYFYRYLDEYTVYLISRPRGLPEGYTIGESADNYARALRELAPVDALGISMGGLIGQQLCVRHPELVDRLVLANSGCRLSDAGREPVGRMLRHARERDWFSIRAELARGSYSDLRSVTYPPFIHTIGRFVLPRPADPDDVRLSLEAILDYDGRAELADVEHPTLVIGGSRDPYFTADVLRETADGVPDARLVLIRGAKHGAFHERKLTFDRKTTAFLTA